MKRLLLILCTFLMISATMHAYFVSVADIEFNQEKKTFEISLKFIGHDLEKVIKDEHGIILSLGTDKEYPKADSLILNYIKANLQIDIDSILADLTFVGKEINTDDFLYCYLKTQKFNAFNHLKIENSLLIENFPKQENIVLISYNKKKYSTRLNKNKTEYNLSVKR